jgi:phosphoribosylglycinamide formyltransferase 2
MSEKTDGDTQTDPAPQTDPEPSSTTVEEPSVATGSTVMLLGSGELSRELVLAFQRLGADVIAVDRYADAPAHGVADRAAVVKMNDAEELAALIAKESPRYVVAEAGIIAADALIAVAEGGNVEVFPTPRSTRLSIDREGLRRLAADELGLPTAPFWFAGSVEELTAVAEHAGFPLVVKPVSAAPGDGQSVLLRADDIEPAWQRAVAAGRIAHNRVMAETVVDVDFEITLLTVRTTGPAGPAVHFCEPIGHHLSGGDVLESWQPQQMSPAALDAAKSIGARIVSSLGGRGVFGVELLVRGDEVYFSDVRPRPYDSGLVTLRSQRLSEFELHARAILGLPVDTIMISPAAAEVSYAGTESGGVKADGGQLSGVLAEALAVAESDVRLFDRPDETDGRRRLGVALATAPDPIVARDRARRVSTALRKLW